MLCPWRRLPCRHRRLRRQSRRLDLAYTAQALRRHSLTTVRTHSLSHWIVVMSIFFLLWIVDFLFVIIYQGVAPSIPIAQPNIMQQLETKGNHSRVGKAYTGWARVGTPQKPSPRRLPHAMAQVGIDICYWSPKDNDKNIAQMAPRHFYLSQSQSKDGHGSKMLQSS